MEFLTPHCPEQVDDWSFSLRQDAIETLGDSQKNAAVTEAAIRACREYAWRTKSTTKRTSRANSLPASFARCLSGHDGRPFGHPITFTVALGPHPATVNRGRTSVHQWSRPGNHSCHCRAIPTSSGVQNRLKTSRTDPTDRVSNPAAPKCRFEHLPSVVNTTIERTAQLLCLSRTSRSCARR